MVVSWWNWTFVAICAELWLQSDRCSADRLVESWMTRLTGSAGRSDSFAK